MSIGRSQRAAHRPRAALRDGGAGHPRRAHPHVEARPPPRSAPSSTCRSATATPTSSSTRTSGRPSPSTTASPAPWPTGCGRVRRRAGRPCGHHHAQPAGMGHGLLGRHPGRRHRRPPQRMVEGRGAALRARGLGLQGRLRRHRAGRARSALPGRPARPRRRDRGRRAPRRRAEPPTGPTRPAESAPEWPFPLALGPVDADRHAARPRPSTPRTTPPSSTPRAPRAAPRAPSARTATCAPT